MSPPSPVPEDSLLQTVLPLAGSSPHLPCRLQIPHEKGKAQDSHFSSQHLCTEHCLPAMAWGVSSVPLLPPGTGQEAADLRGSPSGCRHRPSWPSRPKKRKDIKSPGAALKNRGVPRRQREPAYIEHRLCAHSARSSTLLSSVIELQSLWKQMECSLPLRALLPVCTVFRGSSSLTE